jgi:sortase A
VSTGIGIGYEQADELEDTNRMLQSLSAGVDLLERDLARGDGADDGTAALAAPLQRLAAEIGDREVSDDQRAQLQHELARLHRLTARLPEPRPAPQPLRAPLRAMRGVGRMRVALARGLMALGVCLLLFVGFEYLMTGTLEARSQSTLVRQFRTEIAAGPFDAPSQPIRSGVAGLLNVPEIGLHDVAFVQGASPSNLEQGPGHLAGTPLPGEYGNAVILGHRSVYGSPFAHLDQLTFGDLITVVTPQGRFVYRVAGVSTVRPGQQDVIDPTLDSRLTLVSSASTFSTDRIAVTAYLVGKPIGVPTRPPVSAGADQSGLVGSTLALIEAVLLAQVLLLACLVTARVYRTWPRAAAYAATTPPLLLIVWFLFQYLSQALPGTL